jgi:glycosyltransferase involved in cell wall biosynthesis
VRPLAASGAFTVVFDLHNIEQALHQAIQRAVPDGSHYAGVYTERHVRLVAEAERAAVAAADAVWVCSPEDRAVLGALYGGAARAKAVVVPNAVDVPHPAAPEAGAARVCFTGRMDYYPNLAAGRTLGYEIVPLLHGRGQRVPVVLAGAHAQRMLGGPALPPGVCLLSDPPGIAEVIAGGVMAVPLTIGGGTRFKILEAFAYGAPVVSTTKGAEGIDAVADEHYLRAEHPAGFADALDALVRDPTLRARLGAAGWDLVRDRYSIDALARRLGDLLP